MKVANLEGALLDYWVAMAGEEWKRAHELYPAMTLDPTFSGVQLRGYPRGQYGSTELTCVLIPHNPFRQDPAPFLPSTSWTHGGPIIERERIGIYEGAHWPAPGHPPAQWIWYACVGGSPNYGTSLEAYRQEEQCGQTPLVAAMRAFVASKFGAEVPDEEEG